MSDLGTLLEGVLFGSGRARTTEELAEGLAQPVEVVAEALEQLQGTVKRRRGGAIRVVEVGGRWSMEVKPEVANEIMSIARPELPAKLLQTAALIAYHQPLIQSELVEYIGPKAYDHVRELAARGLIERRRKGNSRRLQTTPRFSEYFGCPYTDRAKVRDWIRERAREVGLTQRLPEVAPTVVDDDDDGPDERPDDEVMAMEAMSTE